MRKYIFAIVAIILLSNISCIPFNNSLSTPKEPIRVYAKEFSWEYKRNEAAADTKYKDKVLEVNGVINNIQIKGNNIYDIPCVSLTDGSDNASSGVLCFFDKSYEPQIAQLSRWQKITIWARVDRYNKNNLVYLKDCSMSNPLLSTYGPISSTPESNP
jgi:hypothetical protein